MTKSARLPGVIVACRVAVLGDERIVVAIAEQPFAGGQFPRGDPLAQQAHDIVHGQHGSDRG